jgi:hypothetical protein
LKKIVVLLIIFSLFLVSCSESGDDLPKLSTAPESSRRALACSMQGILEIIYQITTYGSYPNVTINGNTASSSNAVVDITFDGDDYEVSLSGTIITSNGGSKVTYDITMSRCQSYYETLYCTYFIEGRKNNNKVEISKVILNGIEYKID